ncbi:MAG TPA: histidine phosphatase family protein [Alphaproteobacteria bacterium]|nr:histidine phosphatase family protein [Alphaproteobacteria bacterium]
MTTAFFLVRHAAHDQLGRVLTGRMPGVSLGAAGRSQAARLAERLAQERVTAVLTSPLERSCETAEPIVRRLGVPIRISESLNEIDFGAWTGRSFAELEAEVLWQRWNAFRSGTRTPGGETMAQAQARIVGLMERLRNELPGTGVVLVSHGDMIKAALAHHLGLSLDLFHRIEISPASISVVELGDWGPRVLAVNEVAG